MPSHFLAYMARMKFIKRWGLRRSTHEENDQEHSLEVTMIAHALCAIRRARYHTPVDETLVIKLAIYHEAAEVITGDLASPIKYFNPEIKKAFGRIEQIASKKLLGYLPEDLQSEYEPLLLPDKKQEAWRIVKAADKLSAYLKCLEELSCGNAEFERAKMSLERELKALSLPEVEDFMRDFAPSFSLSLDALN